MNILISLNHSYVVYYTVLLVSVCENNNDVHIFIVHSDDFLEEDMEYIRNAVQRYNASVFEYNIDCTFLDEAEVASWTVEVYYRLLAFSYIPDNIDRILYLDGDMIVNKNIQSFYEQDFSGKCFVACEDVTITGGKNLLEYENVGLRREEPYYNAGVLLINLKRMRKLYSIECITKFILDNKGRLMYPDQSVLNSFFYSEIKWADSSKYNYIVSTCRYEERKWVPKTISIFHFAGEGNRPWNYNYGYHYSSVISPEIWWKYARKTPYRKKYLCWLIKQLLYVKPWQIAYFLYIRILDVLKRR